MLGLNIVSSLEISEDKRCMTKISLMLVNTFGDSKNSKQGHILKPPNQDKHVAFIRVKRASLLINHEKSVKKNCRWFKNQIK